MNYSNIRIPINYVIKNFNISWELILFGIYYDFFEKKILLIIQLII